MSEWFHVKRSIVGRICDNVTMAGGKLNFWGVVNAAIVGFLLSLAAVIFCALLVYHFFQTSQVVNEKELLSNTAPVGKVFYRDGN